MQILGGASNVAAAVSSKNRLLTAAEVFSPEEIGSMSSAPASFAWNSLAQTLTTAGESGILYIQNTDADQYLLIRQLYIGCGKSTAGSPPNATVKVYGNAAALTGTLISAGTAVVGNCRNLGVATQAQATSWAGTEGKTITNGTVHETHLMKDQAFQILPGSGLLLPTNAAIAVSITPGASNTSMIVSVVAVGVYISLSEAVE